MGFSGEFVRPFFWSSEWTVLSRKVLSFGKDVAAKHSSINLVTLEKFVFEDQQKLSLKKKKVFFNKDYNVVITECMQNSVVDVQHQSMAK